MHGAVFSVFALLSGARSHRLSRAAAVTRARFPGRLPNGKYPNGDADCLWISTLEDIPTLPADAEGEVFYLEAGIQFNGFDSTELNQFHSGIGVQFKDIALSVQLYAKDGMANAIFPGPDGQWHNEAVLGLALGINRSYWKKATRIGSITGAAWQDFRPFLVTYARAHKFYQPWRVEDPDGEVYVEDVICDSFSEAAMAAFAAAGARMDPTVAVHRNYATLLTDVEPRKVDLSDAAQVLIVTAYYGSLRSFFVSEASRAEMVVSYYASFRGMIEVGKPSEHSVEDPMEEISQALLAAQVPTGYMFLGSPGSGMFELKHIASVRIGYEEIRSTA